jgi:hypothetical protein
MNRESYTDEFVLNFSHGANAARLGNHDWFFLSFLFYNGRLDMRQEIYLDEFIDSTSMRAVFLLILDASGLIIAGVIPIPFVAHFHRTAVQSRVKTLRLRPSFYNSSLSSKEKQISRCLHYPAVVAVVREPVIPLQLCVFGLDLLLTLHGQSKIKFVKIHQAQCERLYCRPNYTVGIEPCG